jgi:DNA-binding GntR family transcriptional regulator
MVAYDETQAFHRSIAALGGNQIALDWYDKLEAERQGLRMEAVNAYKPEGLQIPLREHGAILQAIVSRDTDQAMTMLHEHLGNAVRVVTGWVQKARANSNQQ